MEWGISRLVFCGVPILRAELHGTVTLQDEVAFVAELETEAGDSRGLIVDASDADTSELSADDLQAMAANWETSRFGNRHPMAAFASSRSGFSASNMLLAHWAPDLTRIFRAEHEAIEWLAKRVREGGAPS